MPADSTYDIGSPSHLARLHDLEDGTFAPVVFVEGAVIEADVTIEPVVEVTGPEAGAVIVSLDGEPVTLSAATISDLAAAIVAAMTPE